MINTADLVEFYDAPAAGSFTLPPAAAMAYFKAKGLKVTFDWRDMLGSEHANAFTIAKMADTDLLADIQASLDDALSKGLSYQSWADSITPLLQQKGWWGRQAVTDPLTGETIVAQLGSPGRLKTIFRTNVQGAYAAGQWQQIQAQKDTAPFLLYDAVDDGRTRPEHAAWDGTILPVENEFWSTHYPPNGWNCRCGVIQLSEDDLEDLGLEANAKAPSDGTYDWKNPRTGKSMKVPKGLDPGWNSNPGAKRLADLQALALEKLKTLSPKSATAAAKGMKATSVLANDLADKAGINTAPVIDGTAANLAKGAGKAQLLKAQADIEAALKANTPNLAKAIKAIQGTKAGAALDPIELLAQAQGKAAQIQANNALYAWKQAKLAGKPGPAAGQAVFDSLPEAAQGAMLAEIEAVTGVKAAQDALKAQLAAIAAGDQGPVWKAALKEAAAKFPDAPDKQLAWVQATPAKLTAGQQAGGLAGWKKNAIAGKPPTDKQQLAFDSLTDKQKANALAQVDQAKAGSNADATLEVNDLGDLPTPAAAAAAPEAIPAGPSLAATAVPDINPSAMVQIGPQKGSNAGGTYVDKATGTEWYVKFPSSEDVARNELLAGKLYEAAGIDVPDLRLVTIDGRIAIASRMVDGLTKGTPASLVKGGAFDGFGVDAWLGNWDVAGATMDNLLMRGAKALRVDVGGSLRYRAQGGLKGDAWNKSVTEIQSLRNAGTAPQAAKVFGKMTEADIDASVAKVLAIDDATIGRLVATYGPRDAVEGKALTRMLIDRRDDLAAQRPGAKPKPAVLPDNQDTARVTAREQADIEAARVNGYTMRTDGDSIEDQNVVVSVIKSQSGKPITRLFMKVRGKGAEAVEASVGKKSTTIDEIDLEPVRAKWLAAIKSINTRVDKGQTIADSTVVAKYQDAWETSQNMLDDLFDKIMKRTPDKAAQQQAEKAIGDFMRTMAELNPQAMLTGKVPMKRVPTINFNTALPNVKLPTPPGVQGDTSLPWQRKSGRLQYNLAQFDKSNAVLTGQTQDLIGVGDHAILEGQGYKVTFVPNSNYNSISSRGMVMIDIDGAGTAATAQGFEILEKIGVKATRSSQADRLELYLDRIAYVRTIRNTKLEQAYEAAGKIADPVARADAKLKLLNADAGRDMTKSRYWNPDGEHQAFGHGRVLLNRPDLDDAEVAAFSKEHVVYHNTNGLGTKGDPQWPRLKSIIEGGGQIGSQVDRVRRGVGSFGSSVESDHASGGANYIFTRLRSRKAGGMGAGIYFNPERVMLRSDAFTYTRDKFGQVDRGTQRDDRQIGVDGWRQAAARNSNETNFRDSLSVFDGVEKIVFVSRAEYNQAIGDMRTMGYRTWPDGRALEDVFDYEGSGKK